jgi:hypothetical protein
MKVAVVMVMEEERTELQLRPWISVRMQVAVVVEED